MSSSKVSECKPVGGLPRAKRTQEVNSGDWRGPLQCVGKGETTHKDDMKLKVFECKEYTVLLRSFVLGAKLTSLEGPVSRGEVLSQNFFKTLPSTQMQSWCLPKKSNQLLMIL